MKEPCSILELHTSHIGRRVLVYDVVDSTNDLAAALAADPLNHGTAVLASCQTAGRGQHGRTWQTPAGSAVLLSILSFPPPALRRPAILTAWAAVAVCETLQELIECEPIIKWPNDILLQGRKVCGILTEQGRGTIVGIGLNVNQSLEDFAMAGLPIATSMALQAGHALDCADVARSLIRHLDAEYSRLISGDVATLEEKWRRRIGLSGRQVRAECADRAIGGRLLEIGFHGLLVDVEGEPRLLAPETVRQLTGL
jgi:BirA family transcriptional regulator, biotin operon repressor / biotin---[acetyl-CoA-carboxylase] ligase